MRNIVFVLFFVLSLPLLSQNETMIRLYRKYNYRPETFSISQEPYLLQFSRPIVQTSTSNSPFKNEMIVDDWLQTEQVWLSKRFSITNSRRYVEYPGLGDVFSIRSINSFSPNERLTVSFGYGAFRSVTPLDLNAVLQLSFHSSVEFKLSDWLYLQVYGQYVTSPVNMKRNSPNVYSYMNPMYPQSLVGTDVLVKYKNIKVNAGPRMMIDSEFQRAPTKRYFNTKVSVGF